MNKYAKYMSYLGFAFLCGLFVITRFWRLDTIPTGLHLDEAGMAYDAWCLAEYGVDRYLNPWPLYLTNYGGGQSILYAYLCAGLFELFGYNIWMVRLPIICSSFLTVLFGMKIAKKCFPDHCYLPFLTGLLAVVCPYFIMNSRYGLDCNLMLGMSAVFLYFFFDAASRRGVFSCVMAGIAGGITLYTYALFYVILPVFLLLGLLYCLWVKSFSFKSWLLMAIPMGLLALPLIVVQLINIFDWPQLHFLGFTFTKLEVYRVGEIGAFRLSYLLDFLKCTFLGEKFNYTSVSRFCTLYGITVALFAVGLFGVFRCFFHSLRTRKMDFSCLILLWFLTVMLLFSHMASNIYRLSPVYLAVVLIATEGIHIICGIAKGKGSDIVCLSLVVAYLLGFLRFGVYYYTGAYTRENYLMSFS